MRLILQQVITGHMREPYPQLPAPSQAFPPRPQQEGHRTATAPKRSRHAANPQHRYLIFAITCPFHGNAGWRWIRDNDPDGWAEAVEFDHAIRYGYPHATTQGQELRGQYFLHRSCQPLDHVDLDPPTANTASTKRHLRLVTASTADENGHPIRTLENRREWQVESDRLADWFLALHPATQRKMTVFVVRCPVKGCLLGRVFRRGDPRAAVRYVWLGVTGAGRGTAGILNWAWDGGRGSKEFMVTGCAHGGGNVEFGLLHGMMEALDFPPSAPPEDWLHHYDEPIQRGYARRTLVLPDTHWQTWT